MAIRPARRRRHPQRLFVTGGSGFLGRHVVSSPSAQAWEVVAPSSGALDLRHVERVAEAIASWRPTAVVHTAYRRDERSSIVEASRHVAEAAAAVGSRLVHVSTDALFAGRPDPYTEADAPTPVHDYGRWKAEAELAVLAADPSAVVVRTSLLFDLEGASPHEQLVRDAISGGSDVAFFTDEVRSPVLVEDLADALVSLADRDDATGVLHVAGDQPFSRSELAIRIARRRGWDPAQLRFSTIADAGLARPAHVVLDCSLARSHGIDVRGPAAWT